MMEISSKLDSRAEYIRQLTQSLANPTGIAMAASNGSEMGDDVSSTGGDSVTSVLYKYGKEATQVDMERLNVRSTGSMLRKKVSIRTSSAQSLDSAEALSELKTAESLAREGSTVAYSDDPHLQFLINKEQNKGRNSQKLVSGSQFRNTTKLGTGRCEQCFIFDKVNKKHKETIRGLRLQIARLEEQNHDLRRHKGDPGHHPSIKSSNSLTSVLVNDEDESNPEDIEFLANKCETYEADLAKMKKMLLYERTLNEGLRKTLDETRTGLRDELATAQAENIKLREDYQRERDKRETLQTSNDELTATLLRYKQQLERTENKLSDCMLQLNAQKNNIAQIDHLKEIDRLKALLAIAEASIKTLTAQLAAKETELARTQEKLEHSEGQLAGLEEKKTAAEVLLHRTQNDMKDAQDLVNSTKKHSAVLQDTLTVAIKEKDVVQRSLSATETQLEQSNASNAELAAEISSLNERLSDLMKRMTKDSENTKKALEKAITASVRLCVVAPTVNVHVADKKLKFKAGLSQDSLKTFLSHEVLEKYSFLFKQKTENSAPDGSGLEPWLQALLGQMQTSIEQHVNSAMDGSSL